MALFKYHILQNHFIQLYQQLLRSHVWIKYYMQHFKLWFSDILSFLLHLLAFLLLPPPLLSLLPPPFLITMIWGYLFIQCTIINYWHLLFKIIRNLASGSLIKLSCLFVFQLIPWFLFHSILSMKYFLLGVLSALFLEGVFLYLHYHN